MAKLTKVFVIRESGTPTAMAAMFAGGMPVDIHAALEKVAELLEKQGVPKDMNKAKAIKKAFGDLLKAIHGAY